MTKLGHSPTARSVFSNNDLIVVVQTNSEYVGAAVLDVGEKVGTAAAFNDDAVVRKVVVQATSGKCRLRDDEERGCQGGPDN